MFLPAEGLRSKKMSNQYSQLVHLRAYVWVIFFEVYYTPSI